MRPIDADELEKILIPEDASGGFWGYGTLKVILDQQPTVDTERYGKWIWDNGYGYWKCTNCNKYVDKTNDLTRGKTKYCPHCGARMDGE